MNSDDRNKPHFHVDRTTNPPRVFLQCSICKKTIREMKQFDSVLVTRGYYCKDCDDGSIPLNPPKRG